MSVNDELGKRMKAYYEAIPKTKLVRRMPVIIRVDGRAFHTFTRGFKKPFDDILIASMQDTMKYLCENIAGCVLGYQQSDEITLILVDYQKLETEAWFNYEVQKLCSISASMATLAFNKAFKRNLEKENSCKYSLLYRSKLDQGAMFDSRCFNIPKEEVTNLVYWRQLDAVRNSIQMVGQANFSQKQLQHKTCKDIKEMLATEKNIVWEGLPTYCQRGSCCIKAENGWVIDNDIPLFKDEGRVYIDNLVYL